MWKGPKNVQDYIVEANPDLEFMNTGKVRCPSCGIIVPSYALVDMKGKERPVNPNDNLPYEKDWACDGCWTRMIREEWTLPSKGNKIMKKSDWLELHGAPQDVIKRFKDQELSVLEQVPSPPEGSASGSNSSGG